MASLHRLHRRAPVRATAANVVRVTGQARMSYRRAAEIFTTLTRPLDADGQHDHLHAAEL